MAETAKLQTRYQMTLPRKARRFLGAKPGDTVLITPVGDHSVKLTVLPAMTLAEAFERFTVDEPLDWETLRTQVEEDMAADALRELDNE
ncbi:MAG: AbrB/MazE/SpoVT family DNA-binding domain-containing protein [Chloroflexia bacterium]|nr:AbrB/MazE/SpoVT family DNA-binding domain-containing protein [Chloroflexia bacterium]